MKLKTTIIYHLLKELEYKFTILNRGGRGSGKTFTTIQKKLIDFKNEEEGNYLFAVNDSNKVTDHYWQTITDINNDLKLGLKIKLSPLTIFNDYGRIIYCRGFSKGEDVKNISRLKFALLDEVQKFDKNTVDIIVDSVRESDDAQVIMCFNPISPDLFVKQLEDDPNFYDDGAVIHTTCEDNPFLPERVKNRYRNKKGIDRKVNYLGEYGVDMQRLVFGSMLERVQEIPSHAVFLGYGLDFSHAYDNPNSDPHALVSLHYADYNLYINEEFYGHCPPVKIDEDTKMPVIESGNSLLSVLIECKYYDDGYKPVIADSSNYAAIDSLNTYGNNSEYGIFVEPAKKGAGSIFGGIDKLKQFKKICITNTSQNVIREFYGFAYLENKKTGHIIPDKYEEGNEHSIDATRYGLEKTNF